VARRGDVLMAARLDRLASIGKAGAGFKSLAGAWADTTTAHGRLMLTVLGGLAEFERELIAARTGEGRKRAKARGVRFGHPPSLKAIQRLAEGVTQTDLAKTYGPEPSHDIEAPPASARS